MIAWQCTPSSGMSMLGRSILPGSAVVEGARENARRRRLADAAHAGEDIGLMDAVGGEGIGERAHHRVLADQVVEAGGAVFAREHAIGRRGRRPPARARPRSSPSEGRSGDGRVVHAAQPRRIEAVGGWTKTRPGSLGLLPSGPDPVGERYVLRQPPGAYVDQVRRSARAGFFARMRPRGDGGSASGGALASNREISSA